jgi:GDP-L-fucose synthase
VIEHARRTGAEKVVVTGTVCSYPARTPLPFREESLWEGYPEATNAPYGIAKKALLTHCQSYRQQYGLNAVYLLPVNLYGPRDHFDPDLGHVIPAMIRRFIEARCASSASVTCWGDGTPTREFLYVTDAADGLILAAERYHGADPVNLGGGDEISIRDLAAAIARLCRYRGAIEWDKTHPNGQLRRKLDTTRARESFGFRARTPLLEGLAATVAWFEESRRPGTAG